MQLILFLLVTHVYARELVVHGHRGYQLSFDNTSIKLIMPSHHVMLTNKECSSKIFKIFEDKMKRFSEIPMSTGHDTRKFNFSLDGRDLQTYQESSLGKFLDSLPDEIQRMKIEEKLRCSK